MEYRYNLTHLYSPFQFAPLDSLPSLTAHNVKFVLETRSRAAWETAPAAPVLMARSHPQDPPKRLPAVSLRFKSA